jgi:hypothetical protein
VLTVSVGWPFSFPLPTLSGAFKFSIVHILSGLSDIGFGLRCFAIQAGFVTGSLTSKVAIILVFLTVNGMSKTAVGLEAELSCSFLITFS